MESLGFGVEHRNHDLTPRVVITSNVVVQLEHVHRNVCLLVRGAEAALALPVTDLSAGDHVIVRVEFSDVDHIFVTLLGTIKADEAELREEFRQTLAEERLLLGFRLIFMVRQPILQILSRNLVPDRFGLLTCGFDSSLLLFWQDNLAGRLLLRFLILANRFGRVFAPLLNTPSFLALRASFRHTLN